LVDAHGVQEAFDNQLLGGAVGWRQRVDVHAGVHAGSLRRVVFDGPAGGHRGAAGEGKDERDRGGEPAN